MSCDPVRLATPGVRGLTPYQPGKPEEELQRELGLARVVKLASNECPIGPSPRGMAAARAALAELHRYPDGSAFRLKRALAERLQVAPECITVGNGSNDVLELLVRAFVAAGEPVVFSEHAFAVYPLATQAVGGRGVVVPARAWGHDLPAMAEAARREGAKLVFVANPNNPTGTWLPLEAIAAFLEAVPEETLVVVDEAYHEYLQDNPACPGYGSALSLVARHSNLVVTRTFSKAYGLAGLRIGYAVSSAAVAELLNRVRQPFNANLAALAAAEAALDDESHLRAARDVNEAGLAQLAAGLGALGLTFIPSPANFLSVDLGRPAAPVYDALLRRGIIVRPVGAYGMPRHLRVSVGRAEENAAFLEALAGVLAAMPDAGASSS